MLNRNRIPLVAAGGTFLILFIVTGVIFAVRYKPQKPNPFDGTSEGFHRFAIAYMDNLSKKWNSNHIDKNGMMSVIDASDFAFNVEKTDSLTTPMLANITFTRLMTKSSDGYTYIVNVDQTIKFGWQNEVWEFKGATAKARASMIDAQYGHDHTPVINEVPEANDNEDTIKDTYRLTVGSLSSP